MPSLAAVAAAAASLSAHTEKRIIPLWCAPFQKRIEHNHNVSDNNNNQRNAGRRVAATLTPTTKL